MSKRYAMVLVAVLAATLTTAESAQAQYGMNAACGYGGCYGAWDVGRLYGVLAQNVPHYAAFPPVYYSAPVPRTYGYSPFAYPPGTRTPDLVEEAAPVEIVNPHFKASAEKADESAKDPADRVTRAATPTQPQVVINPFISSHQTASFVGR